MRQFEEGGEGEGDNHRHVGSYCYHVADNGHRGEDKPMTYQELLEILEHTAQDGMADEPILKALRAVVELHKPYGDIMCEVCEGVSYPCSTIKTIEKELYERS